MTRTRSWLRAGAIAIALAGAVDPALTIDEHERPEVTLTADTRLPDPGLINRVTHLLESRFTVSPKPSLGAAAVVHLGVATPPIAVRGVAPAFVVFPEARNPWVSIERVDAPRRAHVESYVTVTATVRALAARGRSLEVTLESGLPIDRVTRTLETDDERLSVPLRLATATAPGTAPIVIRAEIRGARSPSARADIGVDVRDRRWAVLAFDRRPSWMATFVRRALEADPRFVVTSRISTSRGAAVEAGRPPASLSGLPALELFDAILLGAPEELTEADVTTLETYLRTRGGAVVLLPDMPADGRPYQRLLGTRGWRPLERTEAVGEPAATSFFTPDGVLPGDAVWRASVGAGRLIVSVALDAWKFRDTQSAAFDRYWRLVVAEAADATPPALDVVPDRLVLKPGEATTARVHAGPLAPVETIRVRPVTQSGPEPLAVTRHGARATAAIWVVPDAEYPAPDGRALLAAWASSHSGRVVPESQLNDLAAVIEKALSPPSRPSRWHPMRSAWWIVPLGLALGVEWWERRRRGLA